MKQNYFERKCPACSKIITYKSVYAMRNSEKKGKKCKSCAVKEVITDEVRKKMSERVKGNKNPMFNMCGDKNPFYGKKHNEESKRKMHEGRDYSVYKTDEFRNKISELNKGSNNPMFGKKFYEVWTERYGEEIAEQKLNEYKSKQSNNNKGEKNSMYGKPSPSGSGNGWSGWYNGWFFRSLMELSYMINVIEKFNLEWKNAECDEYTIDYFDYEGNKKTYRADFLIANKYLVEIKPKNLWNSLLVNTKKLFAEEYCIKHNLIYKMREVPKLTKDEFYELYSSGKVKLTERYEKKFLEKWGR